MDDERLKNPNNIFEKDYFEEQMIYGFLEMGIGLRNRNHLSRRKKVRDVTFYTVTIPAMTGM